VPSRSGGIPIRPGSFGKYAAVGPGSWGTNLSLARTFAVAERYRLQVRADAFSAFNIVTLGNPQTDLTSATFGRILNVGGSRTMQMNARFTF